MDLLLLQEEYIKDEQRHLKRELVRAQEEVKRIKSVPLVIGQFLEPIDENTGIVSSTTGSNYVVRILSTLDRELLKPSSSVALHRHSNALVDILPPEADSSISIVGEDQKPDVTYADIGGLDMQKQEIREAVELPLTQGDLYSQIGIEPPRVFYYMVLQVLVRPCWLKLLPTHPPLLLSESMGQNLFKNTWVKVQEW